MDHKPNLTENINVRRVYSSPKVVVYGDFRSITQTVGPVGEQDGGPNMQMSKTS